MLHIRTVEPVLLNLFDPSQIKHNPNQPIYKQTDGNCHFIPPQQKATKTFAGLMIEVPHRYCFSCLATEIEKQIYKSSRFRI